MAKKVNITDKLDLGGNPYLVIGDKELQVNTDAATMLKIMEKYKDTDTGKVSAKEIMEIYEIIFPLESRKVIEDMKLSFTDLIIVVEEAQKLITGEEEADAGEVQTHTTT